MIRLTQIEKKNNIITCQAYFEDSVEVGGLVYDTDKQDFAQVVFPPGFEWCRAHVAQARRFFNQLGGGNPPKEKLIMWY